MKKLFFTFTLAGIIFGLCACGSVADTNAGTNTVEKEDTQDINTSEAETVEEAESAVPEEAGEQEIVEAEPETDEDIYEEDEYGEVLFPTTLEDAQIAAEAFLQLETEGTKAVISNDFYSDADSVMDKHRPGEIFSFIELLGMVKEEYLTDAEDMMPEISYAFIDNSMTGNYSFAVKFGNLDTDSAEDESYAAYVFEQNGDILYLVYSTASRNGHISTINKYGYTVCTGLDGAGGNLFEEGVITRYGKYEPLYSGDTLCEAEQKSEFGIDEKIYMADAVEWTPGATAD